MRYKAKILGHEGFVIGTLESSSNDGFYDMIKDDFGKLEYIDVTTIKSITQQTERYVIVDGSKSGHCCFEYSIIDTVEDEIICETFDKKQAIIVCNALNTTTNERD